MEKFCAACRKPGPESVCGLCQAELCRKCRIFLGEGSFALEPGEIPGELGHTYYCGPCHDEHVAPFKEKYEATVESAKDINVFYRESKSTVRILRKADQSVSVSESPDRDETIFRLAMYAARQGFNSIVDVEVTSKKVRNAGWQKTAWSGRGTPAEVKTYVQTAE
jgi:hypothetical protein